MRGSDVANISFPASTCSETKIETLKIKTLTAINIDNQQIKPSDGANVKVVDRVDIPHENFFLQYNIITPRNAF